MALPAVHISHTSRKPTEVTASKSGRAANGAADVILLAVTGPKVSEEAKALREIRVDAVVQAVRDLCIEANTRLPEEHLCALQRALEREESPLGR